MSVKPKKDRAQETVKVSDPGRVQQARGSKEGDYKSAYGGKLPKRHKSTDGGTGGLKGL
jgi:hypothetical protein